MHFITNYYVVHAVQSQPKSEKCAHIRLYRYNCDDEKETNDRFQMTIQTFSNNGW